MNRLVSEFMRVKQLNSTDLHYLSHTSPSVLHHGSLLYRSSEWIDTLHSLKDKSILIIPDYDPDGIFSGLSLYAALDLLGFKSVHLYTPTMDTGFGLSVESLDLALEEYPKAEVVITTDNGILQYKGVEYAKSKGLVVLITDHHPGVDLEPNADVIVNPNSVYDTTYPFKHICGAQVIWKLMSFYAERYGTVEQQYYTNRLFVFAGLACVSDMMHMLDENRYFVKRTVAFLNDMPIHELLHAPSAVYLNLFKGLWAIMTVLDEQGKLKFGIDSGTIGFYIAPMLNSSRRALLSSTLAFSVFLEDDPMKSLENARELFSVNEKRKQTSAILGVNAQRYVLEHDTHCVVIDELMGYAGIVAGDLTSVLSEPSIVFAADQGRTGSVLTSFEAETLHGSGRAPLGFNLREAVSVLHEKHPEWFVSYGGHAGAIGCTIYSRYYDEFSQAFDAYVVSFYDDMSVDAVNVNGDELSSIVLLDSDYDSVVDYVQFERSLEPYGVGFEAVSFVYNLMSKPVFVSYMGAEKQHMKVVTDSYTYLFWNYERMSNWDFVLDFKPVRLIGQLGVNDWGGTQTPQFIVKRVDCL